MPKKTQQKRRNSKKQKRSMKRSVKRSMRGGKVTIKYLISGDNKFNYATEDSEQKWINQQGPNYVGKYDDKDFGVYHVINQGYGM